MLWTWRLLPVIFCWRAGALLGCSCRDIRDLSLPRDPARCGRSRAATTTNASSTSHSWKIQRPVSCRNFTAKSPTKAKVIYNFYILNILYYNFFLICTGFIEMQDLLYGFTDPNVMDIKMGTRTFLESEVTNNTARPDLYEKVKKKIRNGKI